ncbi:hypothetical protein BO91_01945 [Candidatus Synechococcus spongiarum LMB bulk10E]|nr:hypothetical protein BO91_01945 [Candidatus Synechococcus spongiarum LMB bulk10E]
MTGSRSKPAYAENQEQNILLPEAKNNSINRVIRLIAYNVIGNFTWNLFFLLFPWHTPFAGLLSLSAHDPIRMRGA